jgi:hypothetical protein
MGKIQHPKPKTKMKLNLLFCLVIDYRKHYGSIHQSAFQYYFYGGKDRQLSDESAAKAPFSQVTLFFNLYKCSFNTCH